MTLEIIEYLVEKGANLFEATPGHRIMFRINPPQTAFDVVTFFQK